MAARDVLWDVAVDQYGYVTAHDARDLGVPVVELGKLAARGIGRGWPPKRWRDGGRRDGETA
ncbi:MAG: hypothetical protein LBD77_02095 [Bifidobacteriaceae bacterium]|jgi:hypothetical protein|nr:hypothetical protein [Bifidobacteriaceae bacterium]